MAFFRCKVGCRINPHRHMLSAAHRAQILMRALANGLQRIRVHNCAVALFMLMSCWGGLKHAMALSRFAKLPRRHGFACPACKVSPPVGDFWRCGKCGQQFDTFATRAICPRCATQFPVTKCLDCGALHPMNDWAVASLEPSKV